MVTSKLNREGHAEEIIDFGFSEIKGIEAGKPRCLFYNFVDVPVARDIDKYVIVLLNNPEIANEGDQVIGADVIIKVLYFENPEQEECQVADEKVSIYRLSCLHKHRPVIQTGFFFLSCLIKLPILNPPARVMCSTIIIPYKNLMQEKIPAIIASIFNAFCLFCFVV